MARHRPDRPRTALRPPLTAACEALERRAMLSLPVVSMQVTDATLAEAHRPDVAVVRVVRQGSTAGPLTVSVALQGVATPHRDYTLLVNGALRKLSFRTKQIAVVIPAKRRFASLKIVPRNDVLAEGDENLILRAVAQPHYTLPATLSRRVAKLVIRDDDLALQLASPPPEAALWGDNAMAGRIIGGRGAIQGIYRVGDGPAITLAIDASGWFDQAIDLVGIANGTHAITTEFRDAAGNTMQTTIGVHVDVHRIFGLNFGPYIQPNEAPGVTILAEDQLRQRLRPIVPLVEWVRVFGSSGGLESAGKVAHEFGLKVAQGAWLSSDLAANELEIGNLINSIQAGHVDLAVVGSETLERGDLSSAQLIAYIDRVRAALPAGSAIPVTTADTYSNLLQNPDVVAASDLFFANVYPFWEGMSVSDAVTSLPALYQQFTQAAQGKPVWYSEVGWPSAGSPRGNAVPSPQNAAFYFSNVIDFARTNGIPIFYFEAIDEPWKMEETVGPHWGIMSGGRLKPNMGEVFRGNTDSSWRGQLIDGPGEPAIELLTVPDIGSTELLRGRVAHVNPTQYKVGTYIKVGGGWWTKPTFAQPDVLIGGDGTWSANIATGGNDTLASHIAVFLVPVSYSLPLANGQADLPPELFGDSVTWVLRDRL